MPLAKLLKRFEKRKLTSMSCGISAVSDLQGYRTIMLHTNQLNNFDLHSTSTPLSSKSMFLRIEKLIIKMSLADNLDSWLVRSNRASIDHAADLMLSYKKPRLCRGGVFRKVCTSLL